MKKTTLSMLIALVLVLSVSVIGAYAQEWDEETVLTVFNDLEVAIPGAFSDDDDALFVDSAVSYDFGAAAKSVDDEAVSKVKIEDNSGTVTGKFTACGDGTIDLTINLKKDTTGTYGYEGPKNISYIRDLKVDVDITDGDGSDVISLTGLSLKGCKSSGGDNCRAIYFNKNGEAKITGYVTVPNYVFDGREDVDVKVNIQDSAYMTALWVVPEYPATAEGTATADTKHSTCNPYLDVFTDAGKPSRKAPETANKLVRGRYDTNSQEARIQATIVNYESTASKNFVIPGGVTVNFGTAENPDYKVYTDYICKYTLYNTNNHAPKTEYCKYGEGIKLEKNAMVKFDITIEKLGKKADSDLDFMLRLGGMSDFVKGTLEAVERPCGEPKPVIDVKDPVKPFMTFYGMESDDVIKASGPYSVYEGGVWGMYQKCGRMAFLMVRLVNNGNKEAVIDLNKTAVAINGGTPMNFKWTYSTIPEGKKNIITLDEGEEVTLIGRAHVTDFPSQLNSDVEMTAAVNFLDFGKYITGKLYSDRNNTRCVAP